MPEDIAVVVTGAGLRGYGQDNDRAYQRFKDWVKRLAPGEFFTFSYRTPRNVKFHRKFFALLNLGYDHWEPEQGRKRLTYKGHAIEKSFEQFRKEIVILAGFYEPRYDLKGRVSVEAKSISFAKMTEDDFGLLYEAVLKVLMDRVLTNYSRGDVDRAVAELERFGS